MTFEWDETKNRRNRAKHGVSFEAATLVFDDPDAVGVAEHTEEGEVRWKTVGMAAGVVPLLVVHTHREEGGEEYIRIISARKATPREGRLMRKVSRKVAKELAALARMPDDKIDLTDAPEVREWRGAVVGKFYRPIKKPVTIRVDADVLAWLKRQGSGYQTRINKLLREAMEGKRRA